MLVIALCVLLVAAGVALVARPRVAPRPRGALRDVVIVVAAGLAAGVLAAGAGGRLVMRLLALTSPDAYGSVTEAGEIVGEITLDGTLGFILFSGLPAGLFAGVFYALLRPVLPRGAAGGVTLGVLRSPNRWSARPVVPRRAIVTGRIGLAGLVLVTLPSFVSAVSEIT